jgi:hypothetical protein
MVWHGVPIAIKAMFRCGSHGDRSPWEAHRDVASWTLTMSLAAKAKMARLTKERWAKAKKEGRAKL